MAEVAAAAGVDRTTMVRICRSPRTVLYRRWPKSGPGTKTGTRDIELDAAKAEIAWLSGRSKRITVKLMLVDRKGGWR